MVEAVTVAPTTSESIRNQVTSKTRNPKPAKKMAAGKNIFPISFGMVNRFEIGYEPLVRENAKHLNP